MEVHKCGRCDNAYATEADYLAHTCSVSGAQPTSPAHQGAEFVEVQRAALERGIERAQAEGNEQQVVRNQEALQQL